MTKQELDSVLRSLRSEFNEVPPAFQGVTLRAEFRNFHGKRRVRRNLWWTASGISVAAAAAIMLLLISTPKQKPLAVHQTPVLRQVQVLAKVMPEAEKPMKVIRVRERIRTRRSLPRTPDRSAEFVAIPYTGSFSTAERFDVYRVEMPRAMVAEFGLPLSAGSFDSVATADVVVGNDGVARAIRFVR